MNRGIIIFGSGTIGRKLYYDALNHPDFEIACFAAEDKYIAGESTLLGIPLVSILSVKKLYSPAEYDMTVAHGGYEDMRSRAAMYQNAKDLGYRLRNYISPLCDVAHEVSMKDNNIIFAQTHLGFGGSMGANNLIQQQVYLGHEFMMGDNNVIAPCCKSGGRCIIENGCYMGLGAIVIDSRKIAEETLIGAGSVVIKDTEPYSKNVGNPSRIIGYHKEEGIKMGQGHR